MIENTLLLPSADPIIRTVICGYCNGTGQVEEEEGVINAGIMLTEINTCPVCEGYGEVEIWR